MTQDEIIEMAKQAGMIADGEMWFSSFYKIEQDVHISHLKTFAKLVAQHEREQCIKAIEDQIAWDLDDPESTAIKSIQKRSGV